MLKTRMVGASNRKIVDASVHFGPSVTRMMSSANTAQAMVAGKVIETTRE